MSKFTTVCLLSILLALGACGGGSSSGGGDSGESVDSASNGTDDSAGAPSSIAGTYRGTGTATVSGGGFSETVTDAIQITISEDDTISFGEPGEPPVGTASVNRNGDSFSISVPGSYFNEPGLDCSGSVIVTGTVSGDTITGDINSSDASCNSVPITITGSFNLEKT